MPETELRTKTTGAGQRHPDGRSALRCLAFSLFFSLLSVTTSDAQAPVLSPGPVLIGWEGKVEVSRRGTAPWDPAYTNQVLQGEDLVRTGERSRALVQLSPQTHIRIGERSVLRVPADPARRGVLKLLKGLLYLLHRDQPGEFPVETPTGYAAVLGTEFNLTVAEDGSTRLDLIDGQVTLTNAFGQLQLESGEAGKIEPGRPPSRTAVINAMRAVQWCLYYPAVLHLGDLGLATAESSALQSSLAAYTSGDPVRALALYPGGREPGTDPESLYLAAILLSVGDVEHAEKRAAQIPVASPSARLARALRQMIAAVGTGTTGAGFSSRPGELATEWLAASYAEQAQARLAEALASARRAVDLAPDFSFGWARVAELEFGFGRITAAQEALEKCLKLAPHNAQAIALNGFLLSARSRFPEAEAEFDRAIALDHALGNAWLGRGLTRIRRGQAEQGRQDLQVAATVEPQRALFRSYLGKAFAHQDDPLHARRELDLARRLDPGDPTAWLYQALLEHRQNHFNQAIHDLERSQALNDNRAIYRSRLLLDQDRAVRGANLATLYADAGLAQVAAREAAQAVNADYASYSSHLFLANTYDSLRDPSQVNVRYETPWLSEYLLANLLAPVGAGTLSQTVSQQDYSKLFERDRVGLVSDTEYLSRGDWTQSGAVFGVAGPTGFALEESYRSRHGQRDNNDLDQRSLSLQVKQQLGPVDGLYLQAVHYAADGGDLAQHYDPQAANPGLRLKESQEPLLLAGYHHEWGPGAHTLLLAGRLQDTVRVRNPEQVTLVLERNGTGALTDVFPLSIEQSYRGELEILTGEAQQIWQAGPHTAIVGGRFQSGDFETRNRHGNAAGFPDGLFPKQSVTVREDLQRASAYAYEQWQVIPELRAIGGVTYDRLTTPINHRYAPLAPGEETTERLSPKAGLIYSPHRTTTLRAGYAQSLGGASLDQSFQLEPTQVAGFNQAWRSLIPESVAGANSGSRFETWGVALDEKFETGTYVGLSLDLLKSRLDRTLGAFDYFFDDLRSASTTIRERLRYEERSLAISANQLIGAEWSLGTRYRLSQAELLDSFPSVPGTTPAFGGFHQKQRLESVLHQLSFHAFYNHASGFFTAAESTWYRQSNMGYSPDRPGDDFWQFNALAGYRFPRRRVEVKLGLLNLTDQDYRLNPLNLTGELPRRRTLLANVRFNF